MNQIHEHIKEFRKRKGLTQEQVAQELFVTRQLISKWEQGKSLPDIEHVDKLAKIFGVTINDLIDDESVKSITLKEAIKNRSKTKYIWFSGALSLLAIIITIFLFLGDDVDAQMEEVWLEDYYFITELNVEEETYTFENDEDSITHQNVIFLGSLFDQKNESIGFDDLKINDNIKVKYSENKDTILSIHVIDSEVQKSLYGVFVADNQLEFTGLQDIWHKNQGIRYVYSTDGSSGSNTKTEFSYQTIGTYFERKYDVYITIDPQKVQDGLRIGLITSEGVEYGEDIDLTSQKSYLITGEYALDEQPIDSIRSINIIYDIHILFEYALSEITIFEYDKHHDLIQETILTHWQDLGSFELQDETLYSFFKVKSQVGIYSAYTQTEISELLVGESIDLVISDAYGFAWTYSYYFG